MIDARELRKEYGNFVAVEGSTFSVEKGEVFGVIGPNGAGKTTTLKMFAGLLEPTDGEATVAGFDASDPEMRKQLGFLPEESPLYEEMTPISYLEFFADLYEVPGDVAEERMLDTLEKLDLEHHDRKLGDMSKGMKRKVAIARSLINDPDVLILRRTGQRAGPADDELRHRVHRATRRRRQDHRLLGAQPLPRRIYLRPRRHRERRPDRRTRRPRSAAGRVR